MSTEIVKSTGTALRNPSDDIDFQFSMFKQHGLSPTMAERYEFRPRPDGKYALVKRESPISIFDNGSHMIAVSQVQKTYSEKIGLSRSRGKYNDADRLLPGEVTSVKVGEVAAWATI